jgi:2-iminoacetate synthase ThiH
MIFSKKKSVKEILISYGFVKQEEYDNYYNESLKNGKNIISYLCEKKIIDELKFLKILSSEWGYKAVDLSKFYLLRFFRNLFNNFLNFYS